MWPFLTKHDQFYKIKPHNKPSKIHKFYSRSTPAKEYLIVSLDYQWYFQVKSDVAKWIFPSYFQNIISKKSD